MLVVEFYTGLALFQTHDNLEHLAMLEAVMGPMPLVRKLLRFDPQQHITVADVLWHPFFDLSIPHEL
jgi:hypothetical protein